MRVAICGSMSKGTDYVREFTRAMDALNSAGHEAIRPSMEESFYTQMTAADIANEKCHWLGENIKMIEGSDALLVVNFTNKGIDGYVGANTFWEMAIGFYLQKPIYLMHPPSKAQNCYDEVLGMKPVILYGDFGLIPQDNKRRTV